MGPSCTSLHLAGTWPRVKENNIPTPSPPGGLAIPEAEVSLPDQPRATLISVLAAWSREKKGGVGKI